MTLVVLAYDDQYQAQFIMSQMTDVATYRHADHKIKKLVSSIIKQSLNQNLLSWNFKSNQIFLEIKTNEQDTAGRQSPMLILLDTSNLSEHQVTDYANYFYHGFIDFCHKTGRTPQQLDLPLSDFIKVFTSGTSKHILSSVTDNKTIKLVILVLVVVASIALFVLGISLIKQKMDRQAYNHDKPSTQHFFFIYDTKDIV